jgi:hypothetical protein
MKKILFLFLISFSCFFSCFELDLFKNDAVDSITVTGNVVDINGIPIADCKVTIEIYTLFVPQPVDFIGDSRTDEKGKFIIEFSPSQEQNKTYSYCCSVQKRGYEDSHLKHYIDKCNPKQHFDIVLEEAKMGEGN